MTALLRNITLDCDQPALAHRKHNGGHGRCRCRLLQASKTKYFSGPVPFRPHVLSLTAIAAQTLVLIGYFLLPPTLSHRFEHAFTCYTFAAFATNRVVIYVCEVADIFRFIFGERFWEGLPFFTTPKTVTNAPESVFLHQIFY